MGTQTLKRLGVTLGVALSLLLAPASSVFAQADDPTSKGLEISPALIDMKGDANKPYTFEISVLNVTKNALTFTSSVDDFGAKDETGQPSIILDTDEKLPTSIKNWVNYIPTFTLQASESKKLSVTISIPSNAEPGGHYGVIRFTGTATGTSAGVGQIASAGTLVLVRVSGDAKESLKLASFEATKDNKQSFIFENGPLTFVSRFENDGTIHVKPVGQIEVRDAFGNSTVLPVNSSQGNVLPGSTRRFEAPLDTSWMFGHYTADLSIAYGTTGQAIVRTISFWVIPYKMILLVLAIIITLIYIIRGIRKGKYKRSGTKASKKRK